MDYYLICELYADNTTRVLTVCDSLQNAQIFCFNYEPGQLVYEIWISEGKINGGAHSIVPGTRREFGRLY